MSLTKDFPWLKIMDRYTVREEFLLITRHRNAFCMKNRTISFLSSIHLKFILRRFIREFNNNPLLTTKTKVQEHSILTIILDILGNNFMQMIFMSSRIHNIGINRSSTLIQNIKILLLPIKMHNRKLQTIFSNSIWVRLDIASQVIIHQSCHHMKKLRLSIENRGILIIKGSNRIHSSLSSIKKIKVLIEARVPPIKALWILSRLKPKVGLLNPSTKMG